jgi:cytochrome c553
MEHRERMAAQRAYVETTLAGYKQRQRQEIISQIPYMRLDENELAEYVATKKQEFDNEAPEEEVNEVLKNFMI